MPSNPFHGAAPEAVPSCARVSCVDDIARLTNPLALIACGNDRAVPPEASFKVRDRAPAVRVEFVRGAGHLAHEERPAEFAQLLFQLCTLEPDLVRAAI